MRVVGNCIWLAYSIELQQFLFMVSNIVSVFSSIFISYYKVVEIIDIKQKENWYKDIKMLDGEQLDESLNENI
jgi:hypothetical protein